MNQAGEIIHNALTLLSINTKRMASLMKQKKMTQNPVYGQVAAVSVGIVGGEVVLDLDYAEDSEAETDMNVVMNECGGIIEIQGTAEGVPFLHDELLRMMALAKQGIGDLAALQAEVLGQ